MSAETAGGEKNPLAGNPQAVHDGEELYEDNCGVCHGEHGKGGIGPGLTKIAKEGSDTGIYSIIANGTGGGMPPYGASLDKNKIWALVSYIRSLEGKE